MRIFIIKQELKRKSVNWETTLTMTMQDSTQQNEKTVLSFPSEDEIIVLPDGTIPVRMGSGIVTRILGKGGMAIVYEIWNEQLGIKRAIKLLRPNSSKDTRDRFSIEAKVTAQLDHPNIIDIHTIGNWNGLPYIEMECIEGISLEDLIQRDGALKVELCIAVGIIICKALDYTHHHTYTFNRQTLTGILHRDLKPGNVLISQDGIVRLTDFGIATPSSITTNTSSGKIIGSMQYLAPEQLEEKPIDTRSDIFSFGCVLYEMLTGKKTFPEKNITRLVQKRLRNEYDPLSSFFPSLPSKVVHVAHQCLQYHPNKRPSDISLVLKELEKIHHSISSQTPEEIIASYIKGKKNFQNTISSKQSVVSVLKHVLTHRYTAISSLAGIAILAITGTMIFSPLNTFFSNVKEEKAVPIAPATLAKPDKASADKPQQPSTPPSMSSSDVVEQKDSTNENVPSSALSSSEIPLSEQEQPILPPEKTVQNKEKSSSVTLSKKSTSQTNQQKKSAPVDIPKQPVLTEEQKTVENLKKEYNTGDQIFIMQQEDLKKHFKNVIHVYTTLPKSLAVSKEARLLRHRAFVGLNQINKSYFDTTFHINDGEFYLSKAKYYYKTKQYQQALWILELIKTAPATLINEDTLHNNVLLFKARCNSQLFFSNPKPEGKKTALKSWFDVKNEFRENQQHPYFLEANNEIRNISKVIL